MFSFGIGGDRLIPLQPPVLLPDGTEFLSWQNRTKYSKTFYVDQYHPDASDANKGTKNKPFKSIARAAQILKPGQQVIIGSGTYRELIIPKSGGESDKKVISYKAIEGGEVIISGSIDLDQLWVRSENPSHYSMKLWMTRLDSTIFPAENPFSQENASANDIDIMPWAEEMIGRIPFRLSRGLIFQDGQRLVELGEYADLMYNPGSFWVADDDLTLHIHPFKSTDPNKATIEVTVREALFRPQETDLGYIHLQGIHFTQVGNGFQRTGSGAVFARGGHHWLVEDCEFSEINSVGLEIGSIALETENPNLTREEFTRASNAEGSHIIRNNTFHDCGTGGVQGFITQNTLIENNHFYDIGWQDAERYWECGAIKILVCKNVLVQKNLLHDIQGACGIWLDFNIRNSRITRNTLFDHSMWGNGAIFVEASKVANMVDHNFLWDIDGIPIYGGDSDSTIFAYNFIGPANRPGIYAIVGTDRIFEGKPFTAKFNSVKHNIFLLDEPMHIPDPENSSDENVFQNTYDLKTWQSTGYDPSSVKNTFNATFVRADLTLELSAKSGLPHHQASEYFSWDFWGNQVSGPRTAGPFNLPLKEAVTISLDPRD